MNNDTYEVKVTYFRPSKTEERTEIVVSEKELQVSINLRLAQLTKELGKGWEVRSVSRP